MNEVHTETIIRDGKARQITEYVCSNPACKTPKVLDEPSE